MKKHLPPGTGLISIGLIATLIAIELCIAPGCRTYQLPDSQRRQPVLTGSWLLTDARSSQKPVLHIHPDGSISGFTGVNTFQGRLSGHTADGKFQVDPALAVTLRMGPDMEQEQKFLAILHSADSWQINSDHQLELYSNGKLLAVFEQSTRHTENSGKLIHE